MVRSLRGTGFLRILRISAYSLAVVVILLGVIEVAVRIAHPEIKLAGTSQELVVDSLYGNLQGLRPLARGLSDGEESSVDALGFWKYAARPDSLADGWLLLGDSAAMGIGVEPDSTFAGRLAARWPGWRILNASWIGYSSAGYLNVARALLADHRTSVRQTPVIRRVTLFWTLNDVYSRVDVGGPPG